MKLVFDIGAHKGEDTEFYLKKGFRVVAVEANATLAESLRRRFDKCISEGRLQVVQAAIAEHDGEIEFFANEKSVFGTTSAVWADRNEKMGAKSTKVTVPAMKFQRLIEQYGAPYYLKIDIEGADMLCVEALRSVSIRPMYVSLESNKTSWRGLLKEFEVLESLGYRHFKVVNQAKVPAQYEPSPALEGESARHQFSEGSTGLFGADLQGRWLSKRAAIAKYSIIFLQYTLFGDNTLGQRLASRLPWRISRYLLPDWYDTHAAMTPGSARIGERR